MKHLGELIEIIGDDGIKKLSDIINIIVRGPRNQLIENKSSNMEFFNRLFSFKIQMK